MKTSSLESKTVRPGLGAYSFYHSDRRTIATSQTNTSRSKISARQLLALLFLLLLFTLVTTASPRIKTLFKAVVPGGNSGTHAAVSKPPVNHCAGNKLSQLAIVSISDRHMWACDSTKTVYDSPVVTGISYLAADVTPTGTYQVYGKETNITLTGSDSTGSWSDPVSYWMPFLYNQYGAYGFHDATWRPASDFGNVSPGSANASHGCVELPLSTAKWLYSWITIGTTVTVQN